MRLLTRHKWDLGKDAWNAALEKYRQHYAAIIDKVPPTLREFELLQGRHDFHDEMLIRFHRLARDRVTLELGCYWVELYEVEECHFETNDSSYNDVWLIHEIDYRTPKQFRLMVLFQVAELDVVASAIHVYARNEHRLLIPAAHAPEAANAGTKKKRR